MKLNKVSRNPGHRTGRGPRPQPQRMRQPGGNANCMPLPRSNGLPVGAWSAGWNYAGVMCGPPTAGSNGRNTPYRESNGVYTVLSDPAPAVCNSTTPPSPPAAPKTLTRIQKTDGGGADGWDTTWYRNYWSNGSQTVCTVTSFPDGTVSATGDCAPDGVSNGMTPGNVPAS